MEFSLIQRGEDVPKAFRLLTETWGHWPWREVESSLQQGSYLLILAGDAKNIAGALFVNLHHQGCDIIYIFTQPSKRRAKLATTLLAHLEVYLKHIKRPQKIFLEVHEANLSARKLYDSFGMHVINVRKKYYDDGADALIYMKEVFPS
ncbi:MAG: GNAT family N-acetyltransferase [Deltaproteobacteria bacterium]|nr:GNAT family N-acetyltransferase [Deltaproteobacteria bacterium]